MEIHCFENVGIIAFPAREAGGLNVNFQTSILRHPRMAALFEECFDDDLTRNCAVSPLGEPALFAEPARRTARRPVAGFRDIRSGKRAANAKNAFSAMAVKAFFACNA